MVLPSLVRNNVTFGHFGLFIKLGSRAFAHLRLIAQRCIVKHRPFKRRPWREAHNLGRTSSVTRRRRRSDILQLVA